MSMRFGAEKNCINKIRKLLLRKIPRQRPILLETFVYFFLIFQTSLKKRCGGHEDSIQIVRETSEVSNKVSITIQY